jgi:hypothetical protein
MQLRSIAGMMMRGVILAVYAMTILGMMWDSA